MAKGAMEFENWLTWKTDKASDGDFERFDIRHEFEYGVTDRLQLALYYDWRNEQSAGKSSESDFRDVAIEAIYNLTDPNTTDFGSAIYGEIKGSDDFIELEAKLLLQKNCGPLMYVYNIGAAIEWENDYTEDVAELFHSVGVSYAINTQWSVGLEALHEIAVPEVEAIGDSTVYAGPNMTWRSNRFSAALTGMWQLTSIDDEPDFQIRTILSVDF